MARLRLRQADILLPGTIAAALQSFMYGGATPAGSVFAILQSMGTLKTLGAVKAGTSVVASMVFSAILYVCDNGKES